MDKMWLNAIHVWQKNVGRTWDSDVIKDVIEKCRQDGIRMQLKMWQLKMWQENVVKMELQCN
jgi:hypothetical protein